jgi:hypothetical protein
MAQRNPKLAATAKQQGGDGVLIQSDAQYMGSITTGNVFTGAALTTGTLVSAPMIRREGRFFVIKYL